MVKTITIMDDAYSELRRFKRKDESFSDVVRKLAKKQKTDLTKWFGIIKGTENEAEEFQKRVKKIREMTSKDAEARQNVAVRHLSNN